MERERQNALFLDRINGSCLVRMMQKKGIASHRKGRGYPYGRRNEKSERISSGSEKRKEMNRANSAETIENIPVD
jgi:hypothetical protein